MTVATGHSEDPDSADAVLEVLDACADALGGAAPQAGLLFAGIDHDHQVLLDAIEARHPGLQIIGCTTHGEISSAGFAEDSVVLTLFHSDRVQFRAGVGENTRTNPDAAREAVARALDGLEAPVRLCIALPEGIGGAEADAPGTIPLGLLRSLSDALGGDVPVCGGLAGDQFRFTGTYQYANGRVYSDAVPVLLVAGPVHVSMGIGSGWEPVGGFHTVTDAEGRVVTEIDGERARDLWVRYVGTDDLGGARNAFAVYADEEEGDDAFFICGPSHFLDDGGMVTMTAVPEGARIRFATATRDQTLTGTAAAVDKARAAYPGRAPAVALVFSCATRHVVLGTRVGEEAGHLQEQIGAEIPTAGFYTYGEICPLPASPAPVHHASTVVTVLLGDDA